jgi:hypothetical protein
MQKQKTYTTGQLARIFHVATATIRRWIDSGRLTLAWNATTRNRFVEHADVVAFAREYHFTLPWEEQDTTTKEPERIFGVGEAVVWNSKIGPVEAEYRGKLPGADGWVACVIVRNPGESPYQHMVALSELAKRPEPQVAKPKALRDHLDTDAIDGFLVEAVEHYATSAPTVAEHLDDLYLRLREAPEAVSVLELVGVLRLREEGEWEHPNYAANRIYKLRDRLGMDTTGHLGF